MLFRADELEAQWRNHGRLPFPNRHGKPEPKGRRLKASWLVTKYPSIDRDGPALLPGAFVKSAVALLRETGQLYFAIADEGQFQLVVGAYEKIPKPK